jgi:hypothetical protein
MSYILLLHANIQVGLPFGNSNVNFNLFFFDLVVNSKVFIGSDLDFGTYLSVPLKAFSIKKGKLKRLAVLQYLNNDCFSYQYHNYNTILEVNWKTIALRQLPSPT